LELRDFPAQFLIKRTSITSPCQWVSRRHLAQPPDFMLIATPTSLEQAQTSDQSDPATIQEECGSLSIDNSKLTDAHEHRACRNGYPQRK